MGDAPADFETVPDLLESAGLQEESVSDGNCDHSGPAACTEPEAVLPMSSSETTFGDLAVLPPLVLEESLTVTTSVSKGSDRQLNETCNGSDSLAGLFEKQLTEDWTATASASKMVEKVTSEAFSCTADPEREASYIRSFAEVLVSTAEQEKETSYTRSFTEVLVGIAEQEREVSYIRSFLEVLVGSAELGGKTFEKALGDSFTLNDAFLRIAGYGRTYSEDWSVEDSVLKTFTKERFVEDFAVGDAYNKIFGKGLSELVSCGDEFSRIADYIRTYSEDLLAAGLASKVTRKDPFVEDFTAQDVTYRLFNKNCPENIGTTDTSFKAFSKPLGALIFIHDHLIRGLAFYGRQFDESPILDDRTKKAFSLSPLDEAFRALANGARKPNKILDELLSATEAIERTVHFRRKLAESALRIMISPAYLAKVLWLSEVIQVATLERELAYYKSLLEDLQEADSNTKGVGKQSSESAEVTTYRDGLFDRSWRSWVHRFAVVVGIALLLVLVLRVRRMSRG